MVATQFRRDGVRGNSQQRSGENRANRFKHGGHLPDSPSRFALCGHPDYSPEVAQHYQALTGYGRPVMGVQCNENLRM
ncbi:hypothetical protein GLE_0355 [Lysobacter enzymogenes]|uniref:Uncharacterized protein n=1 Tax=Lysobacter enzymogenes TaxID=69 RepID=A0A0S2DB92_LYSEN|nr:hypothetical protein GLE_0355 [Lysobacter enzymogenes]